MIARPVGRAMGVALFLTPIRSPTVHTVRPPAPYRPHSLYSTGVAVERQRGDIPELRDPDRGMWYTCVGCDTPHLEQNPAFLPGEERLCPRCAEERAGVRKPADIPPPDQWLHITPYWRYHQDLEAAFMKGMLCGAVFAAAALVLLYFVVY